MRTVLSPAHVTRFPIICRTASNFQHRSLLAISPDGKAAGVRGQRKLLSRLVRKHVADAYPREREDNKGGVGYRSFRRTAHPCFLSSAIQMLKGKWP